MSDARQVTRFEILAHVVVEELFETAGSRIRCGADALSVEAVTPAG